MAIYAVFQLGLVYHGRQIIAFTLHALLSLPMEPVVHGLVQIIVVGVIAKLEHGITSEFKIL